MITNLFIINTSNAVKQKRYMLKIVYNKQVLNLVKELIKLQVIRTIRKTTNSQKNTAHVYFNFSMSKNTTVKLNYVPNPKFLKKSELLNYLSQSALFILRTQNGFQNSFFCIKNNLGGKPVLRI
jgi:ribosomal protein S8